MKHLPVTFVKRVDRKEDRSSGPLADIYGCVVSLLLVEDVRQANTT